MDTSDEYLPIFDPKNGTIVDIALRTRAHQEGLYHGHVNVWVPGMKPGTVLVQTKIKSHGKCDATIGGHIDATRDRYWELMGRNIGELGPEKAVKEGGEETGLIFSEDDIIPLGDISEMSTESDPESKLWNNGATIIYMLNRQVAVKDILENPYREIGPSFEEVRIEKLLNLTQKDRDKYLRKLIGEPYKRIFHTLREKMKHV